MPLTPDEALPLAELICVIRPHWNVRGVMTAGLRQLEHHPAPLPVIAWAAIRAAQNPDAQTPAVIPLNGPHWNLADRPPTPRLTPDAECAHHPGQWAATCSPCAADKLTAGHHDDPPTLEADHPWSGPEPLTGRELFQRERQRLNQQTTDHPVAADTEEVTR